jgi:hypothetical protein
MNKMKQSRPCSPYLQRPLRSLDQALKDLAGVVPRDKEPNSKPLGPATLLHFPKDQPADENAPPLKKAG